MKRTVLALTILLTATLAFSRVARADEDVQTEVQDNSTEDVQTEFQDIENQINELEGLLDSINTTNLVGTWTASFGLSKITFYSDGSYEEVVPSDSGLFGCGTSAILVQVGTFTVKGSYIYKYPNEGELAYENTCTGTITSVQPYVDPPSTLSFELSSDGKTLTLTDLKNPKAITYSKVSQ